MYLVLLIGCDDTDAFGEARARAEDFLDAHPRGTAIVQASVDTPTVIGVVGTRWQGADLAAWLAPCGQPAELAADAEIALEPGKSPWEVRGDALPTCVSERLAAFPFEEPSRRGERDLVLVRWRPDEVTEPVAWSRGADGGAEAHPRGLWSQAPPYWRVSLDGEPLWNRDFEIASGGGLLLPPPRATRFDEGPLDDAETWARQFTCPAAALGLVRVALGFSDGGLKMQVIVPPNECVSEKVRENRRWMRDRSLGTTVLRDAAHAMVVIDVPVGPW